VANTSKHNVVLHSGPLVPRHQNMTSSIKPEVHNISQRRQRRIEPRPQATCTKNLAKFGNAVFELCELTVRQTKKQTNKQTYSLQYFTPYPGRSNNKRMHYNVNSTLCSSILYAYLCVLLGHLASALLKGGLSLQMLHVVWSVCVFGHNRELCKNG